MKYNLELSAADVKVNIGLMHAKNGYFNAALDAFVSAQEVYKKHGLLNAVVLVKLNIAVTYALQGSFETALSYLQEVEEYLQNLRAAQAEIEAQGALILWITAFLGRSISVAHYKLGWNPRVSLRSSQSLDEADLWLNMGAVYTELGKYDMALDKLEAARKSYEKRGLDVDQADVEFNISSIHAELGQYQKALEHLRNAEAVYKKYNLLEDQADVYLNAGSIYIELKQYDKALIELKKAQEIYERKGLSVQLAYVLTNYGFIYLEKGDEEKARAHFLQALKIFTEKSMKPYIAFLNMAVGDTYVNTKPEQALYYYHLALENSKEIPEIEWRALYKISLVYSSLGKSRKALEYCKKSIATLEVIRYFLIRETSKVSWYQKSLEVYEHLIELLQKEGEGTSAFLYAERCRARTLLDLLAKGPIGTLENTVEEGIKAGVVEPEKLEADAGEVIQSLPQGTVVLEYFVTERATYAWVIRRRRIEGPVELPHGRQELLKEIIKTRKAMEDQTNSIVNRYLAELYDWLIHPLEGLLPESHEGEVHLVIIPSGPLWYLPFQALLWTDPGSWRSSYLIERYTISYAPSLTVLKYAWLNRGKARPELCLLGIADPDPKDPSIPRLPEAQEEAKAAAKAFPCHELYFDKEATEDVVQSRSVSFRHLLISTHGFFNPWNPMFSYLLLSPTQRMDGKLHAYEVFGLKLGAEIVVLSACETLLPSLRKAKEEAKVIWGSEEGKPVELSPKVLEELTTGEEIVGLTRAFFSAGAASVVSTLWSVPSKATRELMVRFYEGLREGLDKASALREAQLAVLGNKGWEHPYFWAAFCLSGDWGVPLSLGK